MINGIPINGIFNNGQAPHSGQATGSPILPINNQSNSIGRGVALGEYASNNIQDIYYSALQKGELTSEDAFKLGEQEKLAAWAQNLAVSDADKLRDNVNLNARSASASSDG